MCCLDVPGLRSPRTSSKFCLGTTACNVTYLVNEMRHFSKDLTPGNRLGTCQLLNMIHLLLKGFFFFFFLNSLLYCETCINKSVQLMGVC